MRTTITKTVSMMLVTVMVLGVIVMPMRTEALVELAVIKSVISRTIAAADALLFVLNQPSSTSEQEAAISKYSAYFESADTGNHMYVTADQMNQLSSVLAQRGIKVYPSAIPGGMWALCLSDPYVSASTGTVKLDADAGDLYVYEGYTIVRFIPGAGSDEDTDSSSAIESNRPSYAPVDPIQPESPPAGGDGNLVVGPSGTIINQNTTTINQNTINNNDYEIKLVDGRTFYYNQQTDTYYIKNYNGDYVECLNINYNPVTQTYHTTTNEWNSTTNNYDQRQYTYQFYYDYTYITYIGSSAEYREAYKVYFELPDGRSSGDLTVDELKGISLQFDMVNYDKAASDTLTQVLVPFDGSINNTSYYNASASFLKTVGYSFLESPEPFGGYLYSPISNNANTFNNTFASYLQSPLVNSPWTVQFRLYLDGTNPSSPNSRASGYSFSFFSLLRTSRSYWGDDTTIAAQLFCIRDNTLYLMYDTVSVPIAVGVWHDFCICFDPSASTNSQYSFYLDGVSISPSYSYISFSDVREYPISSIVGTHNPYWTDEGIDVTLNSYASQTLYGFGFTQGNGSFPIGIDNFRVVSASLFSRVSSITVPQAPFDTNLAYVLPSVADLNDNTVAIMSQLPVSGYRVGGIRPTDPTLASGYIYMHIDGDFVDSVQQWNGAYWEEVTARLYTGIRWIPVTAFNVFTLEDMFDIIDPDADGSGPGVDSIFQYYLWWSGEWGTFQEWLKGTMQTLIEAIQASGGGGGSTDAPVVIVPGVNDQTTTSEITTENPDGSTTKTTIVSNAAGLVYSNSVTTYPTDANGNTKTITVYTDSSGVMYQTETIIDKDGNVTVTEPTKATGTLGSILKMITGGVMEIAGTVIEGFVTIVVDGVKFIIEAADGLFEGIGDLFTTMFGAVTDFTDSVQDYVNPPGSGTAADGETPETVNIFDAFFQVLPDWLVTGVTLCFVMMIVFPLMNKIHF